MHGLLGGYVKKATDYFDRVLKFEKMAHTAKRLLYIVRFDLESTLTVTYLKDMEEVWLILNLF
jgi:hypothetical protein